MPFFLQKFWVFLKQYWKYIFVGVASLAGILLFRNNRVNFLDQIDAIKRAHEEELRKIEAAREEERRKNKEALEKLQRRLEDVKRQYDEAKIELDRKKKKEIEDLMSKFGDDPQVLAEKLSEATGFKVILPE